MIPGPQVVKTKVRPSETLSPAAKQNALALHGLIAAGEDPAVWTAQRMEVHEILRLLILIAARFNEGEAHLEEIMGALLAGAAWIGARHAVFEGPEGPRAAH